MATTASVARQMKRAAQELCQQLDARDWSTATPWVYNPLNYAWPPHAEYLERYANSDCRILFLGMNPGPWGMVQTGVPFGEVKMVRDWIGIRAKASRPTREHPKRPILGLDCQRSEVSGARLWGLFAQRFGTAEKFFQTHFVANYCPLSFMSETAANITPDKIPRDIRSELEELCDAHLKRVLETLQPEWLIGIGDFAERCLKRCSAGDMQVGKVLHPSPASPAANRDWAGKATEQMQQLNLW